MVNPVSLLLGGRPTARKADGMRGNGTLEKANAVPGKIAVSKTNHAYIQRAVVSAAAWARRERSRWRRMDEQAFYLEGARKPYNTAGRHGRLEIRPFRVRLDTGQYSRPLLSN